MSDVSKKHMLETIFSKVKFNKSLYSPTSEGPPIPEYYFAWVFSQRNSAPKDCSPFLTYIPGLLFQILNATVFSGESRECSNYSVFMKTRLIKQHIEIVTVKGNEKFMLLEPLW